MSTEISHALFVDLTKPDNPKEFPATDLSKKLIEWVGLDVVRFRRNQQVAYRMVDQCRETYDRIIGVIDKIDQSVDEEVDFDQFSRYSDAVDALEEYIFRIMWTSELETAHYFATTDTIHECISGATTWVENRKALRKVASDFTTQDKLLAMFDAGKKIEVERGFVEAANDDDVAFFLDLRATIEAHALVDIATQTNYDLNPVVKTLLHDVKEAISTLGDAIARDNDVEKRRQRQTLSVQFLFVLHGAMEIVVDTSDKVDADWQAHLKSREVWTAAKLVAEHLNQDNKPYEQRATWADTYEFFLKVISNLPGVQVPKNWLELVKLAAKIRRPYLSRAWAIIILSKKLVKLFNDKGNNVLRNVEPLERTFDKAISVLQLASTSWTETSTYDWNSYETQPVVAAFASLEGEIKDRYTMLKAADQWDDDILLEAISKDRERVEKMNERVSKVLAAEHPTEENKLVTVTIKSSVAGINETKMRVSHTTRLSAIRYSLSRQVTVETERKRILINGAFEHGHTLDKDIQTICGDAKNCELSFTL